jgi:serine phosphatase RsbU (regulator of sigma subunit)
MKKRLTRIFQRFRSQLFLAFLVVCLLSIIHAMINIRFNYEKEQVEDIIHQIHTIELNVMDQVKAVNDFFSFEMARTDFYTTSQSLYLNKRKNLHKQLTELGRNLNSNVLFKRIDANIHYKILTRLSDTLNIYIDSISGLIYKRGFKDFGIEGQMRSYAHIIEISGCIALEDLLMLRRHEKDYIIRNEKRYIKRFNDLISSIIRSKKASGCLTELRLYQKSFNELVLLDQQIGIKDNSALRNKLETVIRKMMAETNRINKVFSEYKDTLYSELQLLSLLIAGLIFTLGIFLSLFLSRLITRRLRILSINISQFVGSNFNSVPSLPNSYKNDEISDLIRNFDSMSKKITDQIVYLEDEVTKRTIEISQQNEYILIQNRKMLESMTYAQSLQEAMLPSYLKLSAHLSEHFVFFKPKDIVSGDFYWYKNIQYTNSLLSIIVVADCTGHGVPGGLMSMLGVSALNDLVLKKSVKTSADILNILREKILEVLANKVNGKLLHDGMDVAVVVIDHTMGVLQFSGAYRPLFMIKNKNIIKIKGENMPIGRYHTEIRPFTYTEIPIFKGDSFYMFTNGFVDQHNRITGKKYLVKNFQEFLVNISEFSMDVQKDMIEDEFNWWKDGAEQTDDVLILGFRI